MDKSKIPTNYDFAGYASAYGTLCTDGRTILPGAFAKNDGKRVPLVWHHLRSEPTNVLGHVIIDDRQAGPYVFAYFNESPAAQQAKTAVLHGDIEAMSIYANQLKEQMSRVEHGNICEVSLVYAGANPGAKIDYLAIQHSEDDLEEEEAVIYSSGILDFSHTDGEQKQEKPTDEKTDDLKHEDVVSSTEPQEELTIQQVFETLTDVQKEAVYAIVGAATSDISDGEATQSAEDVQEMIDAKAVFETLTQTQKDAVYAIVGIALSDPSLGKEAEISQAQEGDSSMKQNVFSNGGNKNDARKTLTHEQIDTIFSEARSGRSLRDVVLAHVVDYGIENIDYLFPEARTLTNQPNIIDRDQTWVSQFLGATQHSPFSRIKTIDIDITGDDARAKGYVKAAEKLESFYTALRRVTTPQTVYKKMKLDRDDVLDITDFNAVEMLRGIMRSKLDEELARAALVGDGRSAEAEDKIVATNIRPVYGDDALYTVYLQAGTTDDINDIIDDIIGARTSYEGKGTPNLYIAPSVLTAMLLVRDEMNRRMYRTVADLAAELRVNSIVEVPVMEGLQRTVTLKDYALKGILLNPRDYTFGADAGGQVNMFDDFDIDFNQMKYLIETRVSGALVAPHTAVVIEQELAGA